MSMLLRLLLAGLSLLPVLSVAAPPADPDAVELTPSSRQIMRIGRNQTLDDLLRRIYPGQQALWPAIKRKLREINPQAFNRYTGRLVPGARLRLVTIRRIVPLRELPTLRQVGWVTALSGQALAVDKTGVQRLLQAGGPVYEGDRLETGRAARLSLKMVDEARMFIKPDSRVTLSRYVLDDERDGASASIIDLIKGGLRKITGLIARRPGSIYRFRAGVMTLGVRGTEFVAKLCGSAEDCRESAARGEAQARLHLVMFDGMIDLQRPEGQQVGELVLGQYAVVSGSGVLQPREGEPAPGLLDAGETERFRQLQPAQGGIWPWLIGGAALLAIGL